MIEIIIAILLFLCFCLGLYIVIKINKDKKELMDNTNNSDTNNINTNDIKVDINTENTNTLDTFYTEQPNIIFSDMFNYSEPWRNQLNNDKKYLPSTNQ